MMTDLQVYMKPLVSVNSLIKKVIEELLLEFQLCLSKKDVDIMKIEDLLLILILILSLV